MVVKEGMADQKEAKLARIRLQKLECQRRLRVLSQKLAANPRDHWTRRELEQAQRQLAALEEQEKRWLQEIGTSGGDGDDTPQGNRPGSG